MTHRRQHTAGIQARRHPRERLRTDPGRESGARNETWARCGRRPRHDDGRRASGTSSAHRTASSGRVPAMEGCKMAWNRTRLAGQALIVGSTLAIAGYASAATFAGSSGDKRFTSPLWMPLNGIAIAGSIICILGLPAILAHHGPRAARLTLVGYVGLLLTLLMLNVGEGTTETFVKPYLVTHGGIA